MDHGPVPDRRSRPTLTDLAREAGLSPATVDRVLNNRPGVRPRTREVVLDAARRLGYLPEGPAAPLRPVRLLFLLPAGSNAFMATLRQQIETQSRALDGVEVRVDAIEGFDPRSLARELDAVPQGVDGIGLVALDHPLVREAVRRLAARGIHVVTLASDVQNVPRLAYVGIDNRQAGRLAGYVLGRFLGGREGAEVAVFAGSRAYRGHEEREMGLRAILAEEFPGLRIVALRESRDDRDRAHAETLALLDAHPRLAAIYNAGAGNPGIARALAERGRTGRVLLVGHEATEANKRLLLEGAMDAAIDQNPRVEAREALALLVAAARGGSHRLVPPRLAIVVRENLPDD
ncbi:LacI family DNA-binding transcriptional regulator [Rubellimicrobium sp. CFH 75288]|uniref:LacI family DNA-binding transcriptional regulator n=1 Tax=Rubellimicrobium sp. CFH 75288 TaxID=2697034 RepID=UPI0014134A08|nr:LacI family DNA-binding transcriptional regulator [Rubellimicrobium sp. CFH 75288]NAZ37759.1 substrate-binding domain-containing protein [Rubellimicrobium sp. CFH 75288]